MTRHLWLWLMVGLCAGGCIDRSRLNPHCEWTRDEAFALDLSRLADQRHLVADAQLAEGLAVKFADTEHRRRSGYGGHGGLLEYGGVLRQCYGPLVDRIVRDHRVSATQVDAARRVRDLRFDLPVELSFAGFYALIAYALGGRIRRRFADGSRAVQVGIVAAASAAASFLGIQLGVVWGAIWECVRIGDDHFGVFRASHPAVMQHLGAVFAGGVAVFAIAAFAPRYPFGLKRYPTHGSVTR